MLGPYQLINEVARGGCGVVYRAWQDGLERVVAIKALRPELAAVLPARRRFCGEARVMASLRHRHIMPVHDIGERQGVLYFSMDWAPRSLATHRPGGRHDIVLLHKVAQAVQHAHEQGVIHCDLKPSNVLLDQDGEPLVSDFGLARVTGAGSAGEGALPDLAGTPAYMAPEQLAGRGEPPGPATDVWALGVMLYELLTGRRPFRADTLLGMQQAVCSGELPPVVGPPGNGGAGLEEICRRCMRVDAAQRYACAAELAQALQGWLDG
jgi:serine/threonine-protein kinase